MLPAQQGLSVMGWLYYSDPDNRETDDDHTPARRRSRRKPAAGRRPVEGFEDRYQFVLPGFDHLVEPAPYNPRKRRRVA